MVPGVVKGCVPLKIRQGNPVGLCNGSYVSSDKGLPCFRGIVAQPLGILPAQTHNMGPDIARMIGHLSIKDTREYRGTPSIFILKGGIGGFQLQQCDITIGEAVVHLAGRVFMDRPCHGAAHRCLERMPR